MAISDELRKRIKECQEDPPSFAIEHWEAATLEREARERRAREPVSVQGTHAGPCGGTVTYQSWYEDTAPMSGVIGGGHTPCYTESISCLCERCGSVIGHPDHLAPFARRVAAYRSGERD